MPPIYMTFLNEVGYDKFECDLCTKWYLEDGAKTMVFELRDNIKFHNGNPITSKDMKYSLDKLMGNIDGVANQRMGYIKVYVGSLEAPDNRTFKIHLTRPAPTVPALLANAFAVILPEGTKRADLSAPPLGPGSKYTSGPFYLKEAVPDSHILLERNPNYFKPGMPYLDSIKGQVFNDSTATTTAMLVGKLDLFKGLDTAPPQFWPQLRAQEKEGKLGSSSQPMFCTSGNVWLNFSVPLMQDKRVRQAINLGMDRTEYGTIRYGEFKVSTYFPAGTYWGRPENEIWDVLPGYGRGAKKVAEREQAKKLLVEAGYPNGIPYVELLTGYTDGGQEVMQRGMLSVGINAKIQFAADVVQRWAQLKYTVLDRRLCLAINDPDDIMGNYFLKGMPRNLMAYENAEIERLFLLMSSETDPVKRKQLVRQMENILMDDVANVTLADGAQTLWWNGKIRGVIVGPTTYGVGNHRSETVWLDK